MNDIQAIREMLAADAHAKWAGWMKYIFDQSVFNTDGTYTIPRWAAERWDRQLRTSYQDLPENEKESDRREADFVLKIIQPDLDALRAKLKVAEKALSLPDTWAGGWDYEQGIAKPCNEALAKIRGES